MELQASLADWAVCYERYMDSDIAWHKIKQDALNSKFQQARYDTLALLTGAAIDTKRWIRLLQYQTSAAAMTA